MAEIQIRKVAKSYGKDKPLMTGIDLTIANGEFVVILGPSGCGKSTLVLAMMGLLPPNAEVSGQILFDGVDILAGGDSGMRPHRWRDIAMVFQGAMNAFNPVRTIGEQIAEPIRIHCGSSRRDANGRVGELLEMVGIPARRAALYPHEFSGGMRQRAALAMALACGPKVLLADEPTTALDVIVQAEILRLLRRVSDNLGIALVFISHDLPAVVQVTERVAVMYAGRVVEEAPVSRLLSAPCHPYTRALLAAVTRPQTATGVRSIPGEPPRLDTEVIGCAFAPRCPSVEAVCRNAEPPSVVVGESVVACQLADRGWQG
jgi:oligopeptide/dipeptide ABC transporter ATP-binding protein